MSRENNRLKFRNNEYPTGITFTVSQKMRSRIVRIANAKDKSVSKFINGIMVKYFEEIDNQ